MYRASLWGAVELEEDRMESQASTQSRRRTEAPDRP